jgi:hypothetical protein
VCFSCTATTVTKYTIHSITSYNHSGTYNCQTVEDPTYRDTIGPNYYGVPPATNTVESKSRLLSYYAQLSLPLNNSNNNRVEKDARVKTWSVLQICGLHGASSVILCLSQYFRVFVINVFISALLPSFEQVMFPD